MCNCTFKNYENGLCLFTVRIRKSCVISNLKKNSNFSSFQIKILFENAIKLFKAKKSNK